VLPRIHGHIFLTGRNRVGRMYHCQPIFHAQSMIWATDIIGMENPPFPINTTVEKLAAMPYWHVTEPKDAPEELHPPGINSCFHTHNAAVNAEIRAAALIKDAGYESEVMMSAFLEVDSPIEGYGIGHHPPEDLEEPKGADTRMSNSARFCSFTHMGDVLWNGTYFGTNVHPFEMIFAKIHRDIHNIGSERLTSWMDGSGLSSYK
jgi:hypothetical protein